MFTVRPGGVTAPLFRAESPEAAAVVARDVLGRHGSVVLAAAGGGGGVARTCREVDRIIERLHVAGTRRGGSGDAGG